MCSSSILRRARQQNSTRVWARLAHLVREAQGELGSEYETRYAVHEDAWSLTVERQKNKEASAESTYVCLTGWCSELTAGASRRGSSAESRYRYPGFSARLMPRGQPRQCVRRCNARHSQDPSEREIQ